MIICDRCGCKDATPVFINLTVTGGGNDATPENIDTVATGYRSQKDLCKGCKDEYKGMIRKFLEPKPNAAR